MGDRQDIRGNTEGSFDLEALKIFSVGEMQSKRAQRSSVTAFPLLQAPQLLRSQCACGQHTGGGQCNECKKKHETLQRYRASPSGSLAVPPIVHEVLRSPGQPLDSGTRDFMEPRFGHDFSQVRIHTDKRAAESAYRVNALAYTVGREIVFGTGQYQPNTSVGRRLLAHEMTHVVQQDPGLNRQATGKDVPPLDLSFPSMERARARQPGFRAHVPTAPPAAVRDPNAGRRRSAGPPCSSSPTCSMPIPGSAWDYAHHTEEQEQRNRQAQAANPALRQAAGAARRATNVEQLINAAAPGLLTGITAVWVNPAIAAGAQTGDCNLVTPRPTSPNATCIEVPDSMERGAATFNDPKQPAQIGAISREHFQADTLRRITHEVAHVQFDRRPPSGLGTPDVISQFELSELNSLLSEFPVGYRYVMSGSDPQAVKDDAIRNAIRIYINKPGEGIRGILTKLRCINPCTDVDRNVRIVFEAQTARWPREMRDTYLGELTDPSNHLGWPIPAAPTLRPPAPERPKFGPLYVPRTDFIQQAERSAENE